VLVVVNVKCFLTFTARSELAGMVSVLPKPPHLSLSRLLSQGPAHCSVMPIFSPSHPRNLTGETAGDGHVASPPLLDVLDT
jgi:hypothetical protein